MFTSIIKEWLETKKLNVMNCIEILPNINIDDEYESSNIASEKESESISGNINLK